MDDTIVNETASSKDCIEEEIFNTIVNYQKIGNQNSIDAPVYGPLTEEETKLLEEKSSEISDVPSNRSDALSSVKILFPDEQQEDKSNTVCKLQPKDSAIIHFKKQQKQFVQRIKHKLEICFKLPPKQGIMILEHNYRHPIKEQKDLGSNASVDSASPSNNSKDLHETKSVRFLEHMATPVLDPQNTTELQPKKKEKCGLFKNRLKELHRLRVSVEQKRLELLQLKIEREREAFKHERDLEMFKLERKRALLREERERMLSTLSLNNNGNTSYIDLNKNNNSDDDSCV